MELQGKVIAAIPARKGTSARGEWVAKDFFIETHENFPHKMVFSVFGQDRLDRFNIQVGQEVDVFFDIDAHEYNGRWFNSIRAYDVRQVDPATIGMMVAPQAAPAAPGVAEAAPVAGGAAPVAENPFPPQQPAAEGTDDDLPF